MNIKINAIDKVRASFIKLERTERLRIPNFREKTCWFR